MAGMGGVPTGARVGAGGVAAPPPQPASMTNSSDLQHGPTLPAYRIHALLSVSLPGQCSRNELDDQQLATDARVGPRPIDDDDVLFRHDGPARQQFRGLGRGPDEVDVRRRVGMKQRWARVSAT